MPLSCSTRDAGTDLPKVLLLGDSVTVGYAPLVRKRLEGVADVIFLEEGGRPRNLGNTRGARKALRLGWIPPRRWNVIHFNFGLNDFAYRNRSVPVGAPGRLDKRRGVITVPPDEYEANLRTLVNELRGRTDELIWASTTVVPEGEPARFPTDERLYNSIAARVMRESDVRTDDLNALTRTFGPEMFVAPRNVHYKPKGSARIADRVAAEIRDALSAGNRRPATP